MAKTIVLNSASDVKKVSDFIETFAEEVAYPVDVTVKQHDSSIVSGQRGLYWRWLKPICDHTGYTKEEIHSLFKEKYFLNVYLADPDNHPTFIGIVDAMRVVYEKARGEYKTLRAAVMHGVSHLDATKENWIEVLSSVSSFAQKENIKLPVAEKRLIEIPKEKNGKTQSGKVQETV